MNTLERIVAARDQLNRVLTFFPRVDSKASLLFGANAGLVAVLGARAFPFRDLQWEWIPLGLTYALLSLSLWHVYREAFPRLEDGQDSSLYFREISARPEATYVEAWKKMSDEDHLDDLLGQVWRNSAILRHKFDHIQRAFFLLALAVVPWIVSFVAVALRAKNP